MTDVGQRCKGIVVSKNEAAKELWIHLTKLVIVTGENKYLNTIDQKS